MKSRAKTEFGDFQTPLPLAREVCQLLRRNDESPDFILEPTCGIGTFLIAAAEIFPTAALRGWDVNQNYVEQAKARLNQVGTAPQASVIQQDFFTHDWELEMRQHPGRLLVLGNLPWVTNSAVTSLNGSNLPKKANFLGLRGLAALTGKSNFDISEWMLIRLVRALAGRSATIAILCKSATARKLLRYGWQNEGRISSAALYRIDAASHFQAAVEACLLLARIGRTGPSEADVYPSMSALKPQTRIGLAGKDLVADIQTYRRSQRFEGLCPFQWRSGVKHDCAKVMELSLLADGQVENKLSEQVELEQDLLYPLLKCTDLANGLLYPKRLVLVTQRRIGDDTASIAQSAPRTWRYLQSHLGKFQARKSSIYKGRMPFALFGIGDYAFAAWKVAVSGFHRAPRFQLVGPWHGKPVFLDDTCYYLPFEKKADAQLVADVLNSKPCQEFLRSLLFPDSKRPITVELLQRLNLGALAEEAGYGQSWRDMQRVDYKSDPTAPQLELVMESAQPAKSSASERKNAKVKYGRSPRPPRNHAKLR